MSRAPTIQEIRTGWFAPEVEELAQACLRSFGCSIEEARLFAYGHACASRWFFGKDEEARKYTKSVAAEYRRRGRPKMRLVHPHTSIEHPVVSETNGCPFPWADADAPKPVPREKTEPIPRAELDAPVPRDPDTDKTEPVRLS